MMENEFDDKKAVVKARKASHSVKVRSKDGRGHPSSGSRYYTPDEVEFGNAIQAFKTETGRQFPTNSEILSVVIRLGYSKQREGTESNVSQAEEGHSPCRSA